MKRILIGALIGPALLGLSACNSDNHTAPLAGDVRLVNGIPDSGSITASATSGFSNTPGIGFDHASSTVTVPEGGYNVQLSNDNSASFFTVDNVSVDHNNITTIYTRGSINGSSGTGFAAEENIGAPTSGNFTFQFVNDTTQTAADSLSIYLVAVGGGIGTATPVATQKAGTASTAAPVKAGTYEVIVTSGTTPIYDSGATGGIVLPPVNTNVVQIGALDASSAQQTTDGSLISLIITDNTGGQTLHLNGKS
jgi:hypothetical protein